MTCSGTIGDCDISGSFPEEKSNLFLFREGVPTFSSVAAGEAWKVLFSSRMSV